jgi:hypothetical protein
MPMKRISVILLFIILTSITGRSQKIEFGIQYIPLEFSSLSFDQKYIIFEDYTSSKLDLPGIHFAIPSLSNSGLFVRYPFGRLTLQSGLAFQNNVYYYTANDTYQGTNVSFYYSSIDLPVSLAYTINKNSKIKYRILAGVNSKMFKFKRSYYSVFAKSFGVAFNQEDEAAIVKKREFMVSKVSPFMLYSRIGAGIGFYNFTIDLCADKNITDMNLKKDLFNANFKDSFILTVVVGIRLSGKDMKGNKEKYKISKE